MDAYIVKWLIDYHYEIFFVSCDRQEAVKAYEGLRLSDPAANVILECWNGANCQVLRELW
jgi:hypothetical protein